MDGGRTFSDPVRIGSAERQVSRPYVLAQDRNVWVVWKEFDGKETALLVQSSSDGGLQWSAPRLLARASDYSDHPLLISDGHRVYVSWLARNEGYRLLAVEPAS
jgi:hypothetical protein